MRYLISEGFVLKEEAARTCGWCAQATCTLHLDLSWQAYGRYETCTRIATSALLARDILVTVCCATAVHFQGLPCRNERRTTQRSARGLDVHTCISTYPITTIHTFG